MIKRLFLPDCLVEEYEFIYNLAESELIRHSVSKNEELYVLVDLINEDLNMKFFDAVEFEKLCNKNNITIKEGLMEIVREQNSFKWN